MADSPPPQTHRPNYKHSRTRTHTPTHPTRAASGHRVVLEACDEGRKAGRKAGDLRPSARPTRGVDVETPSDRNKGKRPGKSSPPFPSRGSNEEERNSVGVGERARVPAKISAWENRADVTIPVHSLHFPDSAPTGTAGRYLGIRPLSDGCRPAGIAVRACTIALFKMTAKRSRRTEKSEADEFVYPEKKQS